MQRNQLGIHFESLEDRRVLAATVELPMINAAADGAEVVSAEVMPDTSGHQSNAVSTEAGDFDSDGKLTATDIDLLCGQMTLNSGGTEYDLVPDGVIDQADMDMLIETLIGTEYGDADLDFAVDETDATQMFGHMFQAGTGWASGDFNCDNTTNGFDFLIWLNGRNSAPRVQVETLETNGDADNEQQPPISATIDDVEMDQADDSADATAIEDDSNVTEADASQPLTRRAAQLSSTRTTVRQELSDSTTSNQLDASQQLTARQLPLKAAL